MDISPETKWPIHKEQTNGVNIELGNQQIKALCVMQNNIQNKQTMCQ